MSTVTKKNWITNHIAHIGTILLLLGVFCLTAKALSPEYLDKRGFLDESFFLLPLDYGLLPAAALLCLAAAIHFLKNKISK